MFNKSYYHSSLRKYGIIFGTLFSNIFVNRTSDLDEVPQSMKVPITFGPKEKYIVRSEGDPDFSRQIAVADAVPRMAYEFTSLNYDPERKLNSLNKITKKDCDTNSYMSAFEGVPWTLTFNLYIMVKHLEDGYAIIEQIIPNFTPDFTVTADIFPELCTPIDIPIVLKDVNFDDNYKSSFEERRIIMWTLSFEMKVMFIGPISNTSIIKFASVNFKLPKTTPIVTDATLPNVATVSVRPGLDANGDPTTILVESIPYQEIESDDNYGIITIITENP